MTVSSLTVAVLHGFEITTVIVTLSLESVGANVVEPVSPLLAIVTVFYTLTVCVASAAKSTVSTAILPGVRES